MQGGHQSGSDQSVLENQPAWPTLLALLSTCGRFLNFYHFLCNITALTIAPVVSCAYIYSDKDPSMFVSAIMVLNCTFKTQLQARSCPHCWLCFLVSFSPHGSSFSNSGLFAVFWTDQPDSGARSLALPIELSLSCQVTHMIGKFSLDTKYRPLPQYLVLSLALSFLLNACHP